MINRDEKTSKLRVRWRQEISKGIAKNFRTNLQSIDFFESKLRGRLFPEKTLTTFTEHNDDDGIPEIVIKLLFEVKT